MSKKPRRTGVYGPYRHGARWRLLLRAPDGTQSVESFESEAEAAAAKRGCLRALVADDAWERAAALEEQAKRARAEAEAGGAEALTVGELVERFEAWQQEQGRRPGTVSTARRKLKQLLAPVLDEPARSITAVRAGEIYKARSAAVRPETHRGDLRQARSLWTWAIKAGHVRVNPWRDVAPTGERAEGKEQLREHEALAWYETALSEARSEEIGETRRQQRLIEQRREGALAALCTLVLGHRESEVVALAPRDVESGWAWITKGKTRKSRRRVRIPNDISGLLQERAKAVREAGGDRLFAHGRKWVYDHVRRICDKAGVIKVCAHSMRGLHATLAVDGGETAEAVARQLGHVRTTVTETSYIDPAATAAAAQSRVLTVLQGGKLVTGTTGNVTNEKSRLDAATSAGSKSQQSR